MYRAKLYHGNKAYLHLCTKNMKTDHFFMCLSQFLRTE